MGMCQPPNTAQHPTWHVFVGITQWTKPRDPWQWGWRTWSLWSSHQDCSCIEGQKEEEVFKCHGRRCEKSREFMGENKWIKTEQRLLFRKRKLVWLKKTFLLLSYGKLWDIVYSLWEGRIQRQEPNTLLLTLNMWAGDSLQSLWCQAPSQGCRHPSWMSSQGVYWEISRQISACCFHTSNLPTTPAEGTPTLRATFEILHSTMKTLFYTNSGSSLGKFNSYLPIEAKLNVNKTRGGTEKTCLKQDLEECYKEGK